MSARQPVESLSERAAFLAERHNRVLLNALQTGARVQCGSLILPLKTVCYSLSGGSIDTYVHLDGDDKLIDGALIEHEPASWEATEEQRQARMLLHALQTTHRVTVAGIYRFIHTLKFERVDTSISITVYLTGAAVPVDSKEITVITEQSFLQHPAVAGNHSPRGAT